MFFTPVDFVFVAVVVHDLQNGKRDVFEPFLVAGTERFNQSGVPTVSRRKVGLPSSPYSVFAVSLANIQLLSIDIG